MLGSTVSNASTSAQELKLNRIKVKDFPYYSLFAYAVLQDDRINIT